MKYLFVLTSTTGSVRPARGPASGWKNSAAPYYALLDAGASITLSSPREDSLQSIRKAPCQRTRPRRPAVLKLMPPLRPSSL